ncbi:MAG: L-aspartate oxidase [Candidatus Nanopelagicaceae bacterium]
MRLLAPTPGWSMKCDVVVVGSGVAGLTTALQIRSHNVSVVLVTKANIDEGSTKWAQGGIAAALGPGDSPAAHKEDTLTAGAGLCDSSAVEVLVTEGPEAVRRLIARGAVFDRSMTGEIALTREGGHLRNRILHAGGDATGLEVSRALLAAVRDDKGIEVIEHALVLDALLSEEGEIAGVTLHVIGEGSRDGVGQIEAGAVVIATGGLGQVFAQTTNPSVSTGDGVALALRAGARVADVEFIQFHPTVLFLGEGSKGQQPLISEAVRGEGAFLVNHKGERFMQGAHPLADLAPRDVVAKEIERQMRAFDIDHVFLDARGIENFAARFPTIHHSCLEHGIDPTKDLIPVAPASHYASGGIRVDLNGRSTVPGLYACGETACTGAHGANRLASNSLLEGLVFGARIAFDIALSIKREKKIATDRRRPLLIDAKARRRIQEAMSRGAGVVRSESSLKKVAAELREVRSLTSTDAHTASWETTNLLLLAEAIVVAALKREESRGSHWREDFPNSESKWLVRIEEWLVDVHLNSTLSPLTVHESGDRRWS